jgi:hypothetical protein
MISLDLYLEECARIMGLSHRKIRYSSNPVEEKDEEDEEIVEAEIDDLDGVIAKVRFHDRFWDKEAEEQREIVAHELGHLHTTRFSNIADALKKSDQQALAHVLHSEVEIVVECFAHAIAPLLPLKKLIRPF